MFERYRRKQILKRATGTSSFAKAKEYVRNKRIGPIEVEDGIIRAKVDGRFRNYWISLLWQEDDRIASNCSCSEWQEKGICRHVVAVGLHLIETGTLRKVSRQELQNLQYDLAIDDGIATDSEPSAASETADIRSAQDGDNEPPQGGADGPRE